MIKRNHAARVGATLLILFYGAALFAGFLSPYSAEIEFRDHFFHPPSRIHVRNEKNEFVMPYVAQTYLIDARKQVYSEGSPISFGFVLPDENRNPYIAEIVDQDFPLGIIKSSGGKILQTIFTAKETGENTGIFAAKSVIDVGASTSSIVVEFRGKKQVVPLNQKTKIESSSVTPVVLLSYEYSQRRFPIQLLARGVPYRLFGIFLTDLHLFGVQSPGHFFLMGTDQAGRDIFSRVLHGAQISLTVGLIGVLISTLVGWWIGGIAGYFGGKADALLMRSAEVLMSVPALYLVLSVRNIFPVGLSTTTTYFLLIVVLSLTGWATMARVIRGMVLSLREEEYVLSAKALGATSTGILMRHILPNTAGYVIVRATLLIPVYILAEVTLSYLGIGIQEPAASWGNMLSAAQELRVLEQFSWVLAPGFFLFLTVLGFNFLGDGLRQSLSVREPF
jgi:peptide/nickel transport system permease protein